jgi:hypothetical protein
VNIALVVPLHFYNHFPVNEKDGVHIVPVTFIHGNQKQKEATALLQTEQIRNIRDGRNKEQKVSIATDIQKEQEVVIHDDRNNLSNSQNNNNNISVAMCHKSLFAADIYFNLYSFLEWIGTSCYVLWFLLFPFFFSASLIFLLLLYFVSICKYLPYEDYHYLLGFDAFYLFYRDEVTKLPYWNDLLSLPYVTLIRRDVGSSDTHYDQRGADTECLTKYASHHDWVYIADVDEYLWLGQVSDTSTPSLSVTNRNRASIVKDFLAAYSNMTYLSFGKRMYSLVHQIANDRDGAVFSILGNT